MKLRGRKITILGRPVSVFLATMLLLVAGLASAALLSYYGMVTGTATVEQSVKLNGASYDVETTYTLDGIAGNYYQIPSDATECEVDGEACPDYFEISNAADEPEVVDLTTTATSCPGGCTGDEFTNGYKVRLSYVGQGTDKPYGYDNFKMMPSDGLTLGNIESLTFEYFIKTDDTRSPYFVLITADGDELVSVQNGSATTGEWNTYDGLAFNWHIGTYPTWEGTWDGMITKLTEEGRSTEITQIIIGYGLWSHTDGDRETVLVKDILLNENSVIDNGIIIPKKSDEPVETEWTVYDNRNVEFEIIHDFNIAAYPGTYTIETSVAPA